MCPRLVQSGNPVSVGARQRGFLLPVALFVVVIMGFAALALWRTTAQTSIASTQEVISVQAFYAAESGVQSGLNELFYPNAQSRPAVDNRCDNLSQSLDFSGTDGLNLCSVEVGCELVESGLYRLTADGECGSGPTRAERTLEVEARF